MVVSIEISPGRVAEALGISGTALRRASGAYERVFGPMERDERGARRFTMEASERLQAAYVLVKSGRVSSVEKALEVVRDGQTLPELPATPVAHPDAWALAEARLVEMVELVRAQGAAMEVMRTDLVELRTENAELRHKLDHLELQLPAPGPSVDEVRIVMQEEITAALAMTSRELPAPGPSADDLRDVVRGEVQSAVERLRVVLHQNGGGAVPSARQPEARGGWLSTLLARVGL